MDLLLDAEAWIREFEEGGEAVELAKPLAVFEMPPLVLGRTTFLGGPPGAGKTTLALQYYRASVESKTPSAFLTLEMTPTDLFRRFALQFGGEENLKDWLLEHKEYVRVSDTTLTADEIEQVIKEKNCPFVCIDHLHEYDFADRRELERIVTRLGQLATREKRALLILAQLKRPYPDQEEPYPSDFRETGRIEQIASVLLQFWEPKYSDYIELWCTKNRFGIKPSPLRLELDRDAVEFRRII